MSTIFTLHSPDADHLYLQEGIDGGLIFTGEFRDAIKFYHPQELEYWLYAQPESAKNLLIRSHQLTICLESNGTVSEVLQMSGINA